MVTKVWTFKNVGDDPWPSSACAFLSNTDCISDGNILIQIGALKPGGIFSATAILRSKLQPGLSSVVYKLKYDGPTENGGKPKACCFGPELRFMIDVREPK